MGNNNSKLVHLKLTALALLFGILGAVAWPPMWFFPFIFFAFVPLFYMIQIAKANGLSTGVIFGYSFLAFLVFNLGTTWWVSYASLGGAAMAFVLNSLLMCLPLLVCLNANKNNTSTLKLWPFIWAWLSFEYLHYRWDGSWTWLTLGNVFAKQTWLIQWYEYTGVAGGSLWILWSNKTIFELMQKWHTIEKFAKRKSIFNLLFFTIFAPVFLSYYVLQQHKSAQTEKLTANVVVVQPNVDPYKDKFNGISPYHQTLAMLQLADSLTDSTVSLVVFPETALVGGLNEKQLPSEQTVNLIQEFLRKHPNVAVLTGADTYKEYASGEQLSETAREFNQGQYYDAYNTALFLTNTDSNIGIYHKSKLVPGVERLPFAPVLKFVEKYAINLGGTSGSLGIDKVPSVFEANNYLTVAPTICYESIYGKYVSEFVLKGANLICIITNDGWWEDTPGYKQHLYYASLRAIENRRYIARSANTGISCFINDEGKVLSQTKWWEKAALKHTVALNNKLTFYTKYGDLINRFALTLTMLLILRQWFEKRVNRKMHQ